MAGGAAFKSRDRVEITRGTASTHARETLCMQTVLGEMISGSEPGQLPAQP